MVRGAPPPIKKTKTKLCQPLIGLCGPSVGPLCAHRGPSVRPLALLGPCWACGVSHSQGGRPSLWGPSAGRATVWGRGPLSPLCRGGPSLWGREALLWGPSHCVRAPSEPLWAPLCRAPSESLSVMCAICAGAPLCTRGAPRYDVHEGPLYVHCGPSMSRKASVQGPSCVQGPSRLCRGPQHPSVQGHRPSVQGPLCARRQPLSVQGVHRFHSILTVHL